jgi:colanic acid/amylovoran biosynthesis glycosyltransferase
VKIAYLINQSPQASQTFIRREIAALEKQGVPVERFTVRRWNQPLVDPDDLAEQQKTRSILEAGAPALLAALLHALCTRPFALFQAMRLALRCGHRGDRGRLMHLVYLVEACLLLRWLSQSKIDHLHAHFGTNSTAVAMLCHTLGGPRYSFTCHGPEEFDKPEALKLTEKIHRAAFVAAVSEFGRSQLYRWCPPSDWPRIHVVHCGVDESFLNAAATPIAHSRSFVCIGRLCEQKGQLILIDAMALLKQRGVHCQVIVVGDGTMRSELERRIALHSLGDRIILKGWQTNAEIRQWLNSCRAMILPSFAEGLPVVCMEALALRRPVISTYVAGIPELIAPGQSGWLVPAGDVQALASAMIDALQASDEVLGAMGDAGYRTVAVRHDVSREAAKLIPLFARR